MCFVRTVLNLLIVFAVTGTFAVSATPKKVFIVASYEAEHVCGNPQENGIRKGLEELGWKEDINLRIASYYMDTKSKHTSTSAMEKQGIIALKQIEAFTPDVVVTIDDNAFREIGLKLIDQPDISVVFSGLNNQPENYNLAKTFMKNRLSPTHNVTGVYEKLHIVQSMRVLAHALPDIKGNNIIGIVDYSPTGKAIAKQFEIELTNKPTDIGWKLKKVNHWHEYKELIKELNQDETVKAIYPVALSLKESPTKTLTAPEIFKWTIENSQKPEMALNYFFSQIGLFGGAAVDFNKMGLLAGKKAGAILNGTSVQHIPIEAANDYAIVFNISRAKKLNINIPLSLLTAADHVFK